MAGRIGGHYKSTAQKSLDAVKKKLEGQGKSLNGKDNQVYIGTAKKLWKKANVNYYGYEYIEVNKARWQGKKSNGW